MKLIACFILMLLLFRPAQGQVLNLVFNGDFEAPINLPSSQDPYNDTIFNNPYCVGKANLHAMAVGFHSTLSTPPEEAVPRSGHNMGLIATSTPVFDTLTKTILDSTNIFVFRNYVQYKLLMPLQAGVWYYLTIHVGDIHFSIGLTPPGVGYNYAGKVRNLGAYFSMSPIQDYSNPGRLNYIPHINFQDWQPAKVDTFAYTQLRGAYLAQGGEQYLTIGNFDYYKDLKIRQPSVGFITNMGICSSFLAYTFIDDISLVSDTTLPHIGLGYFSLGADTVLCQNDSLVLGGQPYFFNYLWNTGDTSRFITVSQPGIYWCTVDYGCGTYTDTLLVLSAPAAAAMDMPDTAFCGTQYLAAAPPYYAHYSWSTSDTTPVLTITQPGTYWLEVLDYCGGVHTDTFAVAQVDTIGTPTAIADRVLCNDTAIVLQASPGFPYYAWSTGSHTDTAVIRHPGTYYLTVTNACGIVFEDTITVYQGISSLDLGRDTLLCSAEPALALSVPQALQEVLWSTGDTTHQIIAAFPGLYVVTATSPCGKLIDSIQIDFCTPVIETVSLSQAALCEGMCMTYEAAVTQHPASWQWTFEGGTPDSYTGANPPDICYDDPGTYTTRLIVTNAGGSDTLDTHIQVLPIPEGAFRDTVITVPYGSKLLLPSCGEASAIDWYANGILLCAGCPSLEVESRSYESSYVAILQNAAEGCSDSCVYQIRVNDIPDDLWFPTAFSPNGDGLNDDWGAVTDNPNISLDYLKVYNRWGQLVFQGNTLTQKWDGTYRNTPVAAGVYFWMAAYNIKGGAEEKHFRKGDVTVVR